MLTPINSSRLAAGLSRWTRQHLTKGARDWIDLPRRVNPKLFTRRQLCYRNAHAWFWERPGVKLPRRLDTGRKLLKQLVYQAIIDLRGQEKENAEWRLLCGTSPRYNSTRLSRSV